LWLVFGALVLTAGGRIALTPVLKGQIRRELDRRTGNGAVTFRDLDVFLFPPSFTFKDVAARGPAGDTVQIDRVELHMDSLRELRAAVPRVRARLVRPQLQIAAAANDKKGAGEDLSRILNALPPAQIEVASVVNGTVRSTTAALGRPVLAGITGDIEGINTGGVQVGAGTWQIWCDARIADGDAMHTVMNGKANGSWQGRLTIVEAAAESDATQVPIVVDANVKGTAASTRASVHVSWTGTVVPVTLADARLRAVDDRWPASKMVVNDVQEGPSTVGQSLDIVLMEGDETNELSRSHPLKEIEAVVGVVRLSNAVVLPPPAGLAALVEWPISPDE
jgi:hypothetical protein